MKLGDWAKQQGISYRTALRRFEAGKIPGARQTASKRIYVDVNAKDCAGECVADIHAECLIKKLTDSDVEQLVQRLADAGYVIEHRPSS